MDERVHGPFHFAAANGRVCPESIDTFELHVGFMELALNVPAG